MLTSKCPLCHDAGWIMYFDERNSSTLVRCPKNSEPWHVANTMVLVPKAEVEKLKLWYAFFGTVLDASEYTTEQKMVKLTKLRSELEEGLSLRLERLT